MGKMDAEMYKEGVSGEKMPKGVLASDTSGEKKVAVKGGVGMGKADGLGLREASHAGKYDGRLGELKGGSKEHDCYSHKRMAHEQDGM
jgi:hypothetical protein